MTLRLFYYITYFYSIYATTRFSEVYKYIRDLYYDKNLIGFRFVLLKPGLILSIYIFPYDKILSKFSGMQRIVGICLYNYYNYVCLISYKWDNCSLCPITSVSSSFNIHLIRSCLFFKASSPINSVGKPSGTLSLLLQFSVVPFLLFSTSVNKFAKYFYLSHTPCSYIPYFSFLLLYIASLG